MVRFGFHSCFRVGCNGCLNINNGANAGLESIYEELNDLYDSLDYSRISKIKIILEVVSIDLKYPTICMLTEPENACIHINPGLF